MAPKGTGFTNVTYLAMSQVTPALCNRIIIWRYTERRLVEGLVALSCCADWGVGETRTGNTRESRLENIYAKHCKHTVRSNITATVHRSPPHRVIYRAKLLAT